MNRALVKTVITMLLVFITATAAHALDAEYKNSLTKVELTKINENSYNVNLYTSKKFQEPVKVIKKSDLSYYILLPETKNDAAQNAFNSQDIRSVNTKLYQYAGADVNNGYTKIDINTTKPINFNISIKDNSKISASNNSIAANAPKAAAKINTEPQDTKVQKKNLDFQKIKPQEKPTQTITKKTPLNETKKEIKKAQKPTEANKTKTVKNVVQKTESSEKNITKPVVKVDSIKEQNNAKKELAQQKTEPQKLNDTEYKTKTIENTKQSKQKINSYLKPLKNNLLKINKKLINFKKSLKNKLNEYGLNIKDIILMTFAGIVSFIIMFLILTRKTPQARLKNKADLFDKNEKPKLTPKKEIQNEQQKPNNGQYFVFDKNIKQTGFCDPATSAIKRNYELSSYEPDLRDNYKRAEIEPYGNIQSNIKTRNESEYDIIQKILKEDSFIEIAPDEFKETKVQHNEIKEKNSVTSPIEKEEIKPQQIKPQEQQEPIMLSSVEIAPERGFMCVSFNDNINLMGYIFDDVFALYNFKTPKLENYNIKFRLSEKDDKSASFIVKVDKTKMLIKVTKSYMSLEVVM